MAKQKSALELAIEKLRKDFDDTDVIAWLGEYKRKSSKIQFISTGSIDLDRALVRGGFPTGRLVEVYGQQASGKSTVALETVKNAIKMFPKKKVVYLDAEMAMDPDMPTNMGIDPDKFLLIQANTGNESLTILETLIKSGEVSLAVVDSVDALMPKEEEGKTLDDAAGVGNLPKLMSRACRKFVSLCKKTNTTIIFINQVRQKIMAFGDPETTSGGNALPYYASMRIRVSGSGDTKKDRILDKFGNIIGHTAHFVVRKNKLAAPYRTAEVPLIYGKGFDATGELIRLSEDLGVVEKTKNGFYKLDPTIVSKDIEENYKGFDAFREALDGNKVLRETILDKIGTMIHYKAVDIDEKELIETDDGPIPEDECTSPED